MYVCVCVCVCPPLVFASPGTPQVAKVMWLMARTSQDFHYGRGKLGAPHAHGGAGLVMLHETDHPEMQNTEYTSACINN